MPESIKYFSQHMDFDAMDRSDSINRNREFPSTQWSLIERVKSSDADERQQAIGQLLETYLPVLRAFLVLNRRMPVSRADDFVQDFAVNKILAADIIRHVSQDKGKFRNFLLVCLKNAIRDHYRLKKNQEAAQEDSGFEAALPSQEYHDQFDSLWARKVFVASLEKMKQQCRDEDKPIPWIVFRERVIVPLASTRSAMDYDELIAQTGLPDAKSVQNSLVNAKRRFKKCLESVVREYVSDDEELEQELQSLRLVLARGEALDQDALLPLISGIDLDPSVTNVCLQEGTVYDTIIRDCQTEAHRWSDSDMNAIWNRILATSIDEICDAPNDRGDTTIRDLLNGTRTSIAECQAVRLAGRRLSKDTDIPVYLALYGLAIAAAEVHADQQITALSEDDRLSIYVRISQFAFLDSASRSLLQTAMRR